MSKLLIIFIVVIVIIAGAALYWRYGIGGSSAPTDYGQTQTQIPQDETADVASELQAIQTDGLDAELQDIDKELAQ